MDDFKLRKSWKKQFSENLQQGASEVGGGHQPQIQTPLPRTQVMSRSIYTAIHIDPYRSLVSEQHYVYYLICKESISRKAQGFELFGTGPLMMMKRKVPG